MNGTTHGDPFLSPWQTNPTAGAPEDAAAQLDMARDLGRALKGPRGRRGGGMSDFFDEVLTDPTARWAFEDSRARNELLDSLVSARRMLGLTQDNVAERMGVGQPTVSEFESEGSNPRLATVQRYARAMGARVVFGLILPPPNWQAGDE